MTARPEDLAAFVAGELDEVAAQAMRRHLGTCAACQAELEQLILEETITHPLGRRVAERHTLPPMRRRHIVVTEDEVLLGKDDVLFGRWSKGDVVALRALFKTHCASIYRFFVNKLESDVDQLVMETFLTCRLQRDRFHRQSSFRAFLFAVARHLLYCYWRQRAALGVALDFKKSSVASLITILRNPLALRHDRRLLWAALRTLSLDHQILLELYYWEDLKDEQLAEIVEISPATIRTQIVCACRLLRNQLETTVTSSSPWAAEGLDVWARALRPVRALDTSEPVRLERPAGLDGVRFTTSDVIDEDRHGTCHYDDASFLEAWLRDPRFRFVK